MNDQHLILWHWEALYPYELVHKALSSLVLPQEFSKGSLLFALPYDYFVQATNEFKDSGWRFGLCGMLEANSETFTGSIATRFLVESHANFVLIGKAFDRNQLKEPSKSINQKIRVALDAHVIPCVCFGETREEFEDGRTEEVIKKQLSEALATFSQDEISRIYFVYDTPWMVSMLSDVTAIDLAKVYALVERQCAFLWSQELVKKVKFFCALESFKPISKELIEHSSFAGIYFKMIDANFSPFVETAKEIAPFFLGKIENSTVAIKQEHPGIEEPPKPEEHIAAQEHIVEQHNPVVEEHPVEEKQSAIESHPTQAAPEEKQEQRDIPVSDQEVS